MPAVAARDASQRIYIFCTCQYTVRPYPMIHGVRESELQHTHITCVTHSCVCVKSRAFNCDSHLLRFFQRTTIQTFLFIFSSASSTLPVKDFHYQAAPSGVAPPTVGGQLTGSGKLEADDHQRPPVTQKIVFGAKSPPPLKMAKLTNMIK